MFRSHYLTDALIIATWIDEKHIYLLDRQVSNRIVSVTIVGQIHCINFLCVLKFYFVIV